MLVLKVLLLLVRLSLSMVVRILKWLRSSIEDQVGGEVGDVGIFDEGSESSRYVCRKDASFFRDPFLF